MILAAPAAARITPGPADPDLAYVQARAAAMSGDHARSAALFAALAEAQPGDSDLSRNSLGEAIGAGQFDLALRLARKLPQSALTLDSRLLLVADELRNGRSDRALALLGGESDNRSPSFLAPLVTAWGAADRGDLNGALASLDRLPTNSLLASFQAEERALILLKFRRSAEAEPFARRAIGSAGSREARLRLALADGFLAAGDQTRALAMIEGMGIEAAAAKQRILARRFSGQAIDSSAKALSEVVAALAADVTRVDRSAAPIGLVQVARYAAPENSNAAVLLALLLDGQDRTNEALAVLRTVPATDALAAQARDVEVRILTDEKRLNEAFTVAQAAATLPTADASDLARVGDVLEAMKRHDEAANAYGRAIALARAQGLKNELWPLLLLQASSLEAANRWPETKQALQQALAIAPDQPLLLNFLGYAKLEHGEDLDAAEAMVVKASELAPNDASITDSLGWARFKRGRLADAITTLQQAAAKDPQQADIQEHLGDALYASGRHYEARFAWSAALVTAEDDVAARVKSKLQSGLTPANAAP